MIRTKIPRGSGAANWPLFSFAAEPFILKLFMTPKVSDSVHAPEYLKHELAECFPKLLRFDSIAELEASPIHREIRGEAERILNSVVYEEFAEFDHAASDVVLAAAWNIERGTMFEGILAALREHPGLAGRDVYHLTELDHGMARSENRFVAQAIAREFNLAETVFVMPPADQRNRAMLRIFTPTAELPLPEAVVSVVAGGADSVVASEDETAVGSGSAAGA